MDAMTEVEVIKDKTTTWGRRRSLVHDEAMECGRRKKDRDSRSTRADGRRFYLGFKISFWFASGPSGGINNSRHSRSDVDSKVPKSGTESKARVCTRDPPDVASHYLDQSRRRGWEWIPTGDDPPWLETTTHDPWRGNGEEGPKFCPIWLRGRIVTWAITANEAVSTLERAETRRTRQTSGI
ncbi:hypothetical protein BJX96DRAFT_12451 [Aspergillus floccosus]